MVQCVPVVVWNVPDPNDLLNKSSGRGLYKDGQILPWEHLSKLQNTSIFATYLHHARRLKWNPNTFNALTPAHFLGAFK